MFYLKYVEEEDSLSLGDICLYVRIECLSLFIVLGYFKIDCLVKMDILVRNCKVDNLWDGWYCLIKIFLLLDNLFL